MVLLVAQITDISGTRQGVAVVGSGYCHLGVWQHALDALRDAFGGHLERRLRARRRLRDRLTGRAPPFRPNPDASQRASTAYTGPFRDRLSPKVCIAINDSPFKAQLLFVLLHSVIEGAGVCKWPH